MATARSVAIPFAVACLGIALFSGMDAAMKGLAIALGAYNAMLWRVLMGICISAGPYLARRTRWPSRSGLRVHVLRGAIGSVMAVLFFYGIARVPLAEGIALSFIAPLIALYLAAVLLGETVERRSVIASVIGIAGVVVLLIARSGGEGARHWDGVAAILVSALLYSWNLILMRQQALLASPLEVGFFQNLTTGGFLLLAAPFFAIVPSPTHLPMLALAAVLAFVSLVLISWAYGRAEAQVLVLVEYTAFIWAAIMGAVFYGEAIGGGVLAGAVLIVAGCVVATWRSRGDMPAVEPAL